MVFNGPTNNGPFEPLHLTREQQQQCQDLILQLLDRTLRSYDERNECVDSHSGPPRHHANLDKSRWKQLKTHANASLYVEKASGTRRDLNRPGGNRDKPSVLVAVGTIDDNLDEVMFGLETSDFASMKARSNSVAKHHLEGAVLAQFAGPTEVDPFQFMGVTRLMKKRNWPLKLVAHHQDFVFVSATGVMTHTDGQLMGYEVVQSIDLPQCPPLPKPIVRAKVMYGALFRQREEGNVDVFVQTNVEAPCHLHVFDKLVAGEIWELAIRFWKAPSLSEMKKLQWCMDNKSVLQWQQQSTSTNSDSTVESKHCENCPSKRSSFARRRSTHLSDHSTCALCMVQICSNCRAKRTLKVPDEHGAKLLDLCVAVCQACMVFVHQQKAAEITLDNQRQRETSNKSKSKSTEPRSAHGNVWGLSLFSPLGTNRRYPSISVSDLIRMINSLSDVGMDQVPRASQTIRRKTDPH